MAVRRGRPRVLNEEVIKRTILHYTQEVITSQSKIISKHNEIWTRISKEIGQIQPHALYTLVVNNRFNIKSILFDKTIGKSKINKDLSNTNSLEISSIADLSKKRCSPPDEEPEYKEIDIIFNKNEFENLIETK